MTDLQYATSRRQLAEEPVRNGPQLRIGMCDPKVRRIEGDSTLWFVSGAFKEDCNKLLEKGSPDGQLERGICEQRGDASIVKIAFEDGTPQEVSLWRGLSSSYLLYICETPEHDFCVSDSFRWLVSCLPSEMRSPSEAVLVDHFLFGSTFGENTHSSHVGRVAHGDEVHIDLKSRVRKSRGFDRIPLSPPARETASYVKEIDECMIRFVKTRVTQDDSVMMFSGGIDSSLLAYYTGRSIPCINMRTKAYNLNARLEAQYCDDTASLLGLKCDVLFEDPADFPEQLVACVDSLGAPPHQAHMLWFDDAFRKLDYRNYIVAERADALFGLGGRVARLAAYFTWTPAFELLQLVTAILPPSERLRWHTILPAARQLRHPPESVHSYGAQTSTFTDFQLLGQIFTERLIEERLQARLDYILERVTLPKNYKSNFLRQFEISQWIKYFCTDVYSLYRQCAHANRKSTFSPFINKDLLRVAADIPGDERYIKDGQGKYLLKRLLHQKVPGYDVNQRKAFPSVPFSSQYPDGPLKNVWERYPFPDFIDGKAREAIVSSPLQISWQAVKYAVWEQTIRQMKDLAPPIVTDELRATIG